MTDTPSEAAIKEALRLMNEYETRGVVVWTEEDANLMIVRVLALRLDFEDRVARAAAQHAGRFDRFNQRYVDALRSLMLPDQVDPLEEALASAWPQYKTDAPEALRREAAAIRAELDKRGLTIAPKDQGRLTDAK